VQTELSLDGNGDLIVGVDQGMSVGPLGNKQIHGAPVGDSSGLTNANASTLFGSGTLPDARLSANVAMLNAASNLFSGTIIARGFECPTNAWAVNTPFGLGTNANYASSTATFGITGVANLPSSTERAGKLVIKASGGNITFTNSTSVPLSDHLTSRVITNGYTASLSVVVIPGFSTNGYWVHQ
jgi:hypothetical protein